MYTCSAYKDMRTDKPDCHKIHRLPHDQNNECYFNTSTSAILFLS